MNCKDNYKIVIMYIEIIYSAVEVVIAYVLSIYPYQTIIETSAPINHGSVTSSPLNPQTDRPGQMQVILPIRLPKSYICKNTNKYDCDWKAFT